MVSIIPLQLIVLETTVPRKTKVGEKGNGKKRGEGKEKDRASERENKRERRKMSDKEADLMAGERRGKLGKLMAGNEHW